MTVHRRSRTQLCNFHFHLVIKRRPCPVSLGMSSLDVRLSINRLYKTQISPICHLPTQHSLTHSFGAQSCLTPCDPTNCSPPGSSVHGILQASILQQVAIPFSKGSSWPRDQTWVSCITWKFFSIWATRKDPAFVAKKARWWQNLLIPNITTVLINWTPMMYQALCYTSSIYHI